jgi:carboxyl-terminal processing protease
MLTARRLAFSLAMATTATFLSMAGPGCTPRNAPHSEGQSLTADSRFYSLPAVGHDHRSHFYSASGSSDAGSATRLWNGSNVSGVSSGTSSSGRTAGMRFNDDATDRKNAVPFHERDRGIAQPPVPFPVEGDRNSDSPDTLGHPDKPDHRDIGLMDESAVDAIITARYTNPVTRRAIRSMSRTQAVELFAEISHRIDERHLQPTNYQTRTDRALLNLQLALGNPEFLSVLNSSASDSQIRQLRTAISAIATTQATKDFTAAQRMLQSLMQQAERLSPLAPAAVAFEVANAGIETLDQYSGLELSDPSVMTRNEEIMARTDLLQEQIVGIGIEVRDSPEGLIVVRPLRGSPAAKAGMRSGDIILQIDGQDIRGVSLPEVIDMMKGQVNTDIELQTYRAGRGNALVRLTRRSFRVWSVHDVRVVESTRVGYLSLSRFSQKSAAEVDQALEQLHQAGMKSLIVDLRGNPGGLLTTCIDVADRFLPCGVIVSTRGRLSADNMVQEATFPRTWDVPIVVLIDHDSASASEILAAAIQENRRGLVVGSQSYGKGSVQTHFPLNSISGDLRLTTAMFYSPQGHAMAGRGVVPDFEVIDHDGPLHGDEVLQEAARVAESESLQEMARAAGICSPRDSLAIQSSMLEQIIDPAHPELTVL